MKNIDRQNLTAGDKRQDHHPVGIQQFEAFYDHKRWNKRQNPWNHHQANNTVE